VVFAHKGALHACYELEAIHSPALQGGLTVSWTVDPRGAVRDVILVRSSLHDARVEDCVMRQVRAWLFPSSELGTRVTFPFLFGVASRP